MANGIESKSKIVFTNLNHGALFMANLKSEIKKQGYDIAHITMNSIRYK